MIGMWPTKITPALLVSSVHAAVIAINEAVDQGVPEGTLAAMQNANAMLVNLDPCSARQYHDTLYQAKGEKVANSRKRVSALITGSAMMARSAPFLGGHKRPTIAPLLIRK